MNLQTEVYIVFTPKPMWTLQLFELSALNVKMIKKIVFVLPFGCVIFLCNTFRQLYEFCTLKDDVSVYRYTCNIFVVEFYDLYFSIVCLSSLPTQRFYHVNWNTYSY